MKESSQLRHMNYEMNDLLVDRYNFISYDDNIELRCYIAEAMRENDIFKLTKMISSISGEG